jgi:hypothetical protein
VARNVLQAPLPDDDINNNMFGNNLIRTTYIIILIRSTKLQVILILRICLMRMIDEDNAADNNIHLQVSDIDAAVSEYQ